MSLVLTRHLSEPLEQGRFYRKRKKATVMSLLMDGSKWQAANYRLVSLTYVAGKLTVHVVIIQLREQLETHYLFRPNGFKKRCSCLANFLAHECWSQVMIVGCLMDVVCSDFREAFGKFLHHRLITELKSLDFPRGLCR